MNLEQFKKESAAIGIDLTSRHIDQFNIYLRELEAWNATFNLTAIREPEEVILKHFFDSLTVAQALPPNTSTLIDIGSGAGFPGIPLKIIMPALSVTLVDASAKKVSFLSHITSLLELTNTIALHGRTEELGHDPKLRESFDVVVGRAVAEMAVLAEYCLPFAKKNGLWIAQKSLTSEPLDAASKALSILGGTLEKILPVTLPGLESRQLIIIKKTEITPSHYPRRAGLPSKKPL